MDTNEAIAVIQDRINKSIDAKLVPAMGLMIGLEVVIAHMFNCLHRKGVLSLDEAMRSLAATSAALPPEAGPLVHAAIRHVEQALAGIQETEKAKQAATPEAIRTTFRVLPGGLSEGAPEGSC